MLLLPGRIELKGNIPGTWYKFSLFLKFCKKPNKKKKISIHGSLSSNFHRVIKIRVFKFSRYFLLAVNRTAK